MHLRYRFCTPSDLLNKVERERSRALLSAAEMRKDDMCDHFFNFCVTAHALRDWTIKDRGLKFETEVNQRCNSFVVLAACRDIANSDKHFSLDANAQSRAIAKGAVVTNASYLDLFSRGATDRVLITGERIAISVVIEGHRPMEYVEFTGMVLSAWKELFKEWGIAFRSIYDQPSSGVA